MKNVVFLSVYICLSSMLVACEKAPALDNYSGLVNKFVGTGGDGRVAPVASVPFGMMQLGADTRSFGSGYHYNDTTILGFSHLHKSGGGCADFLPYSMSYSGHF